MHRFRENILRFWFPAISDEWLAVLRIGLGLHVVLYTLSLRGDWNYFFDARSYGLISRDLSEAVLSVDGPLIPRLGWLVSLGSQIGISESATLLLAWIGLLAAGCCLLAGLFCRPAAILAWFLYLSATKSGQLLSYGMDSLTTTGLFYLMLSPLPDAASLDARIRKSPSKDPQLVGFFRRVLQLHLCLIYFFSGLTKVLGEGWWNGSNLWRALNRPPFTNVPPELLVSAKVVLPVAGIVVCFLEITYPFFIWPRRTRFVWLYAIVSMHAAIGFTMGMYLFGFIMIVLNLAAFGPWSMRNQQRSRQPLPVAEEGRFQSLQPRN